MISHLFLSTELTTMLTAILVFCLVLLIIIFIYKRTLSPSVPFAPKIKWRWPYFGNGMDLSKTHLILSEWSKFYGPVFRYNMYGEEIVVLNDYKTIYEGLVTRASDFAGRPKMARTDHVDRSRNSVVWQSYTAKLKVDLIIYPLIDNIERRVQYYSMCLNYCTLALRIVFHPLVDMRYELTKIGTL